ncbi:sensor domain-containing diguanylate cyclase [Cognatiyoonia sp. IB215446]|uniref:sensor domain-containing diguanylate cyclase n=1 Tax=Cognatiyoonia sp. IB215446 TaxID=3097355 RepID=UPI002A0C8F43|nr:sensor domain-containing diguanylate cyclase [Cognatiyoonia sp. IB215446]MDX8346650.1 sensor domain-containing diguanylate cyclase [Cognatiyoonia sp. IB215446]
MTDEKHFVEPFRLAEHARAAAGRDALQVPIGFLNDLSQATSRGEVLDAYSLWSKQIVAADRCSIALHDDTQLVVTAMTGTKGVAPDSQYGVRHSIAGAVYREGRSAYVPDPASVDSPGVQTLANMGYRTIVIVPLMTKSRRFGVINASFFGSLDQPGNVICALEAIGQCLAMQLQVIEQMETLTHMARIDALTGVGNRRLFYEEAEVIWDQWRLTNEPFCYLAMDLDHFKQINDTYGHDVGDAVLTAFAQRVSGRSRGEDTLIRMGGEEFGLLMKATQLEDATRVAKRLCDGIGDTPFSVANMQLMVTASFGLTQVHADDHAVEETLKRADIALYEAKTGGRDQVVVLSGTDLAA